MSLKDAVLFQDPKSVLVVSDKGLLRQLFVPFRVQCVIAHERIPVDSYVFVDAVFLHRKYLLLYWINQTLIPYHHFTINIAW